MTSEISQDKPWWMKESGGAMPIGGTYKIPPKLKFMFISSAKRNVILHNGTNAPRLNGNGSLNSHSHPNMEFHNQTKLWSKLQPIQRQTREKKNG